MAAPRTIWHYLFAALVRERAPPEVEVRAEVPLGAEPQRIDLLLLRRSDAEPGKATVLTRLWTLFTRDALVEFKSVARPFRRGDLPRLLGYGAQYHVGEHERLDEPGSLTLVLVGAGFGPALDADLVRLGWSVGEFADGYAWAAGAPYPLLFIDLDAVAAADQDDLLAQFGHPTIKTAATVRWWQEHLMANGPTDIKDLEGYDEALKRFLQSLTPEERVEGLTTEERVRGLTADALAQLTPEQLEALADRVRAAGRRRD